jgi:hypothetical protein
MTLFNHRFNPSIIKLSDVALCENEDEELTMQTFMVVVDLNLRKNLSQPSASISFQTQEAATAEERRATAAQDKFLL